MLEPLGRALGLVFVTLVWLAAFCLWAVLPPGFVRTSFGVWLLWMFALDRLDARSRSQARGVN